MLCVENVSFIIDEDLADGARAYDSIIYCSVGALVCLWMCVCVSSGMIDICLFVMCVEDQRFADKSCVLRCPDASAAFDANRFAAAVGGPSVGIFYVRDDDMDNATLPIYICYDINECLLLLLLRGWSSSSCTRSTGPTSWSAAWRVDCPSGLFARLWSVLNVRCERCEAKCRRVVMK